MTKNRLFKKVVAVGVAAAMVMGMGVSSFAATSFTKTDALNKALSNAGLTPAKVMVLEQDYDDGNFEIEFVNLSTGTEYTYEISKTGKILEKSLEYDRRDAAGAKQITLSEAKSIALSKASVKASAVHNLRAALDDGKYEVEFVVNASGNEYDFEISKGGLVLEKSVEYGKYAPVKTTTTTTTSTVLTKSQIKAKALKNVGLKSTEVKYMSVELDDGRYEVEFVKRSNGTEYSFEYTKKGTLMEKSVEYHKSLKSGTAVTTKAQARAKVAKFSGISKTTVANGTTTKVKDDGRYEYKVKFHTKTWNYKYEVDAKSGKITEWSKVRR